MAYIKNSVKHSLVEQGFALGCTSRLDRIDVCEQIPAVQAGEYFYSPNTKEATKTVGKWSESDVCFCGFINSHRTNKRDFSEPDIQFAERLLVNFRMPYLWFGLLVITEQKKEILFYKLYSIEGKTVLKPVQWRTKEKNMWTIILLIVGIALIKIGIEGKKEKLESKKIEPPTEDVYILGCCGSVECGYWGMEYYTDSSGRMEIRKGVCRCSYQGKTAKEFSQCPYAKEHPNTLRLGIFGS